MWRGSRRDGGSRCLHGLLRQSLLLQPSLALRCCANVGDLLLLHRLQLQNQLGGIVQLGLLRLPGTFGAPALFGRELLCHRRSLDALLSCETPSVVQLGLWLGLRYLLLAHHLLDRGLDVLDPEPHERAHVERHLSLLHHRGNLASIRLRDPVPLQPEQCLLAFHVLAILASQQLEMPVGLVLPAPLQLRLGRH